MFFFFFSSRRRHTRWPRDWSSDVCSSDLPRRPRELRLPRPDRYRHDGTRDRRPRVRRTRVARRSARTDRPRRGDRERDLSSPERRRVVHERRGDRRRRRGDGAVGRCMTDYVYRLLNVFTTDGERLSGNPLCVFENGRGLDDATMLALARQFNLSETTFILPSDAASAAVRIFTPTFEMPFAGHPTLGTAHVVRALGRGGERVTLAMKAGVIPVTAEGDRWTLEANAPRYRDVDARRSDLAEMLGLSGD